MTARLVTALAAGLALPLVGCPRGGPPVPLPTPAPVDPLTQWARATAEPQSGPVYAPFTAVLATPDSRVTANGTLVVSPPDKFRIELRGPIGPPQVIVACDGTDVRTWVLGKNTLYLVPDADIAVSALLGSDGSAPPNGADVAASILLGRVPPLPGVPTATGADTLAWTRENGDSVVLGLDAATAHLGRIAVHTVAGNVLRGSWTPGPYPQAVLLDLPTLGVSADVKFGEWKPAAPTSTAFFLPTPEGAEEKRVDLSAGPAAPGRGAP